MADIQFPNVLLSPPGTFDAVLIDNNGDPSTVLDAGLDFTINANWTISSLAALLLGGQFEVAAYAEAIGAGPEQQIGNLVVVPLDGSTNYSATVTVPANTLPILRHPVRPARTRSSYCSRTATSLW